ncbi:hypothetical protein THAOC_16401 [Thalassiosira oceanica]|uniref:Uncharacterized protein n=1 Tax=Thalassiosira oceanica TaxID=159749 RepID=K0SDD5_THAOC|nr:hypothetical protein THAOC_16401 [Thalassiosira oceanica]|eukprot:EJK62969.1 hypothetical protein THAOC_16401 [Thalassiosira oceanica]
MTNIGGRFAGPLSIDSDSDDEDDSARLNLVPSSWLATWQKPAGTKLPQLPDISDRSSSLADSWASQVWSTVDSARSWVNASSSSSGSTSADNSWVSSSLSSAMKAVSAYNPFSGEEKVADAIEQQNNTSATRRRLSSNMFNLGKQLEAASKINPYQAVAGRDDIYLLSSPNAYTGNFFEFFSLTSWLTRIASGLRGSFLSIRDIEIKQRTSTESVRRKECQRIVKSKNMPSGASVEAVKNLLLLVQDQAELKVQENESNEQFDSSGFDDSAPSSPPPASNDGPVPLPLLSTPGASFDSERSGRINPRSSPVRTPSQAEADIDKSSSKELFSPVSSFRTIKAAGEAKGRNEWQNDEQSLNNATHVEMAARLAEGALRMYRDLALDEANELHAALHYWTVRWERPMLGWLEAGPNVWLSDNGYNPYYAGKKVSQIQAVLARRCAVVGEIQQHLWRANWRKGVADWGMLGNASGGQWSTVVGEFGSLAVKSSGSSSSAPSRQNSTNDRDTMKIFNHSSLIGSNVSNLPGGSIVGTAVASFLSTYLCWGSQVSSYFGINLQGPVIPRKKRYG